MSMVAAIDRLVENQGMEKSNTGRNTEKNVEKRPVYSYYPGAAVNTHQRSLSPSSSPYVIDFKGRARFQGAENPPFTVTSKFRDPGPSEQASSDLGRNFFARKPLEPLKGGLSLSFKKDAKNGFQENDGKFLNDRLEIISAEGNKSDSKRPPLPSPGLSRQSLTSEEFFDASEYPFSDTSSQAGDPCEVETVPEAVTCKKGISGDSHKAEKVLELVLQKLAAGGLEVPPSLDQVEDLDIAGQLYIKRFVEAAVARGAARAEIEEQLDNQLKMKNSEIENKNREVTRLRDKVRYNELVSHEMFQRNQESLEIVRNRRRIRRKVARWVLGGVCVAVGIAVARKYVPSSLWRGEEAAPPSTDVVTEE